MQRAVKYAGLTFIQLLCDIFELQQGCLQTGDDLLGQHIRIGQVLRIFQGLILQPEDVQADLVTRHDLIIGEGAEALGLLALVAVFRVVTLDEIFQVFISPLDWF